ncbi:MAG: hypothetical protein EPN39_20795 [Chitinophagaceae bacterium]|nr:MAG: hypothetical protein EPN39_20795 [Chitinophagaceae bacterium]
MGKIQGVYIKRKKYFCSLNCNRLQIYYPMKVRFTYFLSAVILSAGGILAGVDAYSQSLPAGHQQSKWVYYNHRGALTYKTLKQGDKIMDFSYAGYEGGGVSIPDVPVKVTLDPQNGDNTKAIQQAIDEVSTMPLVNGFRGAVLLHAGMYNCDNTIMINASGVVLRGSGSGKEGTIINMTGKPHLCILIKGSPGTEEIGSPTTMATDYVPSGADTFSVADPSGFKVGDTIRISRPVTPSWVHFMGMDVLVRNGRKETWITGEITIDRVIKNIDGKRITINIPFSDDYASRYLNPPGTSVVKITMDHISSQIGIENFQIVSPAETGTINERHHTAFSIRGITDGWARDINIFNTVNSVSINAKRITLDHIDIIHQLPTTGSAKPADLSVGGEGTQVLFNQCHITGDNVFYFATGAKVSGPVVLLHCTFNGNGWIQPHQRWATGLLVDNCQVPDGGIDLMNRGEYGSGHGWAIGWSVAWNCKASTLLNQQPPGSMNWMIGCEGERQRKAMPFNKFPLLSEGIDDAYGKSVNPSSLYLAQLSERLGQQAVKNIGY